MSTWKCTKNNKAKRAKFIKKFKINNFKKKPTVQKKVKINE
jgi:hypothetical protein